MRLMRWSSVFWKEITENLRDRRTIISTFLVSPLMGPVLFAGMFAMMISLETQRAEKPLALPIIGVEHAPNFVSFLEQHGVEVKPAPKDPEAAIRKRDFDTILRISADFGKKWRAGESAEVEMLFDPSRQTAQRAISRTQAMVEGYSKQMGAMRLVARGISPEVVTPIQLRQVDLSTPQSRSGLLLAILPYMLFLTLFIGGMSLAIDVTAGERERQSLEPLLINPLSRSAVMLGKVSAAAAFALAALLLSIVLFAVCFKLVPLEQLGMQVGLGVKEVIMLFVFLTPLAFIASAAQTALAAFAKSFREAQTQVSMLMLLPGLPSLVLALNPIKPQLWYYAVPFFGQSFLIESITRGEAIDPLAATIAFFSACACAALLMVVAGRMYHRESLAVSV